MRRLHAIRQWFVALYEQSKPPTKNAVLTATITRADGTVEELGTVVETHVDFKGAAGTKGTA
jgi:hypothetical protein